ncbi:hypothetical protein H5410_022870 [Solanum commersonii]|uniref:Uncharacterized protein n=1 Tax=Solanum commersonii TaxID=4109 RepID=A0A9J5ZGN4_SOLCO|nr:hypothetical protein H5410_022870 [Solanum commersonii]
MTARCCYCGIYAELKMLRTPTNPGRMFWGCQNYSSGLPQNVEVVAGLTSLVALIGLLADVKVGKGLISLDEAFVGLPASVEASATLGPAFTLHWLPIAAFVKSEVVAFVSAVAALVPVFTALVPTVEVLAYEVLTFFCKHILN